MECLTGGTPGPEVCTPPQSHTEMDLLPAPLLPGGHFLKAGGGGGEVHCVRHRNSQTHAAPDQAPAKAFKGHLQDPLEILLVTTSMAGRPSER